MYAIGDTIQNFTLLNHQGQSISFEDFRGKKVLIWFYPRASTPGCTAEGCSLRDHFPSFQENNIVILGISMDSVKKLATFVEKQSFPYDLLSDPDKIVIDAFGAWGPKKMAGNEYEGILRSSFLIDEEGKLAQSYLKVQTKTHGRDVLNSITKSF